MKLKPSLPAAVAAMTLMLGGAAIAQPIEHYPGYVPPPPPVVTNPDWVRKPTGDDLARFYPDRAQREEMSGAATVSCSVTVAGTLEDCVVVSEGPGGYGFGAAALRLTETFQMSPKTMDGVAVAGGTVRIPIIFRVPEEERPEREASNAWVRTGITIELMLISLLARVLRRRRAVARLAA